MTQSKVANFVPCHTFEVRDKCLYGHAEPFFSKVLWVRAPANLNINFYLSWLPTFGFFLKGVFVKSVLQTVVYKIQRRVKVGVE